VSSIRVGRRRRRQVRVGAPDRALTANAGLAAVTELCDRLGVVEELDAAVGPIKQRDRGFGAGELLTGIAAAQLAGEDFLTGLDRQRADAAGQQVTPVPGLASTTAAGLARRFTPAQWQAIEQGVAAVTGRMLSLLPAERALALADGPVTIDLDTTDVEVYGSKKRGVAWNHQGQRVGRPHAAAWAETERVLAADLGDGTDDPRATAPDLLRRALACLPPRARQSGRIAMRADAGYFAGQLARAAYDEHIGFAIGARRIAPLWRLLAGLAGDDWHETIEMDNAEVAVAQYCPDWWPANTALLIRRVLLDPQQVSADPRSRRRRTPHPACPADPRARQRRGDLRLQLHPDEPGRDCAGQGGRRGALVPAPHDGGEYLPRRQGRRRAAAPPQEIPPGQHGLDVVGTARREHGRLAAASSPRAGIPVVRRPAQFVHRRLQAESPVLALQDVNARSAAVTRRIYLDHDVANPSAADAFEAPDCLSHIAALSSQCGDRNHHLVFERHPLNCAAPRLPQWPWQPPCPSRSAPQAARPHRARSQLDHERRPLGATADCHQHPD
jgi:hypothetical protein